jgi:hypothetical protein
MPRVPGLCGDDVPYDDSHVSQSWLRSLSLGLVGLVLVTRDGPATDMGWCKVRGKPAVPTTAPGDSTPDAPICRGLTLCSCCPP